MKNLVLSLSNHLHQTGKVLRMYISDITDTESIPLLKFFRDRLQTLGFKGGIEGLKSNPVFGYKNEVIIGDWIASSSKVTKPSERIPSTSTR